MAKVEDPIVVSLDKLQSVLDNVHDALETLDKAHVFNYADKILSADVLLNNARGYLQEMKEDAE
jgi:hypothetical protein